MKKLFGFAILAMCMFSLTSCDEDEGSYVPKPMTVSSGAFIVNGGNIYNNIPGSLTYIDYAAQSEKQNVFSNVNGRTLGLTANDALVYGDKMYVVVSDENIVEVIDKNTMVSLKQIKTTDAMGEMEGITPRHIVAGYGFVYVSTYGGYVAKIDTVSLAVKEKYHVGSYPEGMAIEKGKLYVANSDYAQYKNPSLSYINLADCTIKDFKDDDIVNPVDVKVVNGALYVLDNGKYDASFNQVGAGIKKVVNGKVTHVAEATMMAVYGSKIYIINNPYGASSITYGIYDTTSGQVSIFPISEENKPFSPVAIGVDPVKGDVFITSYKKDPDTGYPHYSADGYVNMYKQDGTFVKKFNTGIYPIAVAFNVGVVYE